MVLVPDTAQAALYRDAIRPHLTAGKTLMFAHGFNVRFGTLDLPGRHRRLDDRAEVARAPRARAVSRKGPARRRCSPSTRTRAGRRRRSRCRTRKAHRRARAPACIETTFAEETETDLFGEQAVLCGGVSALVKAGFETLVEAGYQPEVAYFECLHELKLIVDLMYQGGLNYMRYSVSDTAEHGDYTGGPRLDHRGDARRDAPDARRRSRTAPTRAAGSPRTRTAARGSTRRAAASSSTRSKRSARSCAR